MKLKNKVNAAENLIEKNFPKKKGLIDYLNSDDSRNVELGVRLTKGLCTKIGDDYKKLHEIVVSQNWNHHRFGAIREFFTKSQFDIIHQMIDNKNRNNSKRHGVYLANKKPCMMPRFYTKIREAIADKYYSNYKNEWLKASITHSRDIDKFEFKLGSNNGYQSGYFIFHLTFNFYDFEMSFVEMSVPRLNDIRDIDICLFTPKNWDGKSDTIAFCFSLYPYSYIPLTLHKGIIKDGVFHKKNITSIRKDYLEIINK